MSEGFDGEKINGRVRSSTFTIVLLLTGLVFLIISLVAVFSFDPCEDVDMQQLEKEMYETVMEHDGKMDSGRFQAYMKPHKRTCMARALENSHRLDEWNTGAFGNSYIEVID